ncbi:hypothetical protein PTTG_12065 [Puccinia triticina 1-1 BBBD Race 1]|uniref:Uncharacterized protein n=1 Tax=Puccinia triticina (isolate 1-1 / race 1 (BBBD)) TaxID=630390 RepID=A0A180GWY8_PUCT1|nr:hypothetical protein PTTG_12065 [Puccinia triticina 1-1 BBBD Race 1]
MTCLTVSSGAPVGVPRTLRSRGLVKLGRTTSSVFTCVTLCSHRHTSQFSPAYSPSDRLCPSPMAQQAEPDSSKLDTERNRFLKLHSLHKDPAQLFRELKDVAGLDKVQQHNSRLESVFQFSELADLKRMRVGMRWINFIEGKVKGSLNDLTDALDLTEQADEDKIKELVRCAYFVRFPIHDASRLSRREMLDALEGPTTRAKKKPNMAENIQWSTEIVQQGFNAEYQKHDLIVRPTLETLERYAGQWEKDTHKAPYTSIIGPSMCGKTRLLKELAAHVCVVYICLREPNSNGQPPRSEIASHFFPLVDPELDMTKHYCHLLAAILNTVSQFFSRPEICAMSLEDQLSKWYEHSFQIDNTRKTQFTTQVQNEMNKIQLSNVKSIPGDKEAADLRTRQTFVPDAPDLETITPDLETITPDLETITPDLKTRELLAVAVESMHSSMKNSGHGNLKVLLAIDEASMLINHIDQELEIPYFRVFRRALSAIPSSMGFFSVFTDTTSRVANFNPALDRDPSTRFHGVGVDLFAPIYKVSALDVFVSQDPPSSWDELLSPERLFTYGCPFYGLYFKGAMQKTPRNAVETTALIAKKKLLLTTPSGSPLALTNAQCFAILGSVIQTRVSLHSPINSQLVASHAAHCMYIDSTREMIVSDYPPQFVYASAANAVLASDDAHWIESINTLASAVKKGLVALGDAGEMATRLILIRAMQKTEAIPHENGRLIPNGYSVRLVDFIKTLSGEDPSSMKFDCKDANDRNTLLNKGRIFFNHITRISYTPSATDLLEFLYRGVAVQCRSREPGFDELFTIYLAPTTESPELHLDNITFCGVQTKNQADPVRSAASPDWSKSFAGIQGINNPYLVLLFSLRNSSSFKWKPPEDAKDDQRVSYQFLGLDKIACLTSEMRSALERLITAIPDDLLNLHDNLKNNNTKDWVETKHWVEQLSPVFYPRAPKQQTPQTPAPSQKPSKRCRT